MYSVLNSSQKLTANLEYKLPQNILEIESAYQKKGDRVKVNVQQAVQESILNSVTEA